jgi:hypothetical protein
MVQETLGDAWLDPDWFRFGASTLLNDVVLQLEKERTGGATTPTATSQHSVGPQHERPPTRELLFGDALDLRARAESRRPRQAAIQKRYGHFIGGRFVDAGLLLRHRHRPRHRAGPLARSATATRRRRRQGGRCGAPALRPHLVARCPKGERGEVPVPHRPHHPGARPRAGGAGVAGRRQAHPRERDVDVPLAAAHFFYYAGWADKLRVRDPGRKRRGPSAWPGRSSRGTSRC